MKTKQKADIALVFVTFCWGTSYYLSAQSLTEVTPLALNGLRFLLAFFIAFAVSFKKTTSCGMRTVKWAALLGALMSLVYVGATVGLVYTTQSNAGFLCGLAVVITPILKWIFQKKRPENKLLIVMVLAVAGVALMSLSDSLAFGLGDLLCLSCSFTYALHIMLTEHIVADERVDAFSLAVYQLGFTGVFSFIFSFIFETPTMPSSPRVFIFVAILAIFCTGLTIIVQTIAQKYTTAETVGVIFTAEPVFAAIIAFLFAGEVLAPRAYVGMALLFFAILLMELDVKKLLSKRKAKAE